MFVLITENFWRIFDVLFDDAIWCRTKLQLTSFLFNSCKVNSVQKGFTKCFSKFEILKTTWRNKTKNIKMLNIVVKNWKLRVWCAFGASFLYWVDFELGTETFALGFMKENAYFPERENEGGRATSPTSISIFGYYDMKTL